MGDFKGDFRGWGNSNAVVIGHDSSSHETSLDLLTTTD